MTKQFFSFHELLKYLEAPELKVREINEKPMDFKSFKYKNASMSQFKTSMLR